MYHYYIPNCIQCISDEQLKAAVIGYQIDMPPNPIPPPPLWPMPRLKFTIEDLDHEGAEIFLTAVQPKVALREAVIASFKQLYTPETAPTHVEQISLVLRPMKGVAHTLGSKTQKEIHFSLDYIKSSAKRAHDEIMGVLVHEVVHCYQYDACGTCPGGLIEGIADFVRLREGFDPPHWSRKPGETWDAGYEKTGYFLDWIEERYGTGTIRELNECMKDTIYREMVFKDLTGRTVPKLWKIYRGLRELENESKGSTIASWVTIQRDGTV